MFSQRNENNLEKALSQKEIKKIQCKKKKKNYFPNSKYHRTLNHPEKVHPAQKTNRSNHVWDLNNSVLRNGVFRFLVIMVKADRKSATKKTLNENGAQYTTESPNMFSCLLNKTFTSPRLIVYQD